MQRYRVQLAATVELTITDDRVLDRVGDPLFWRPFSHLDLEEALGTLARYCGLWGRKLSEVPGWEDASPALVAVNAVDYETVDVEQVD